MTSVYVLDNKNLGLEETMTMISVMRVVGALAAVTFVGQLSLVMAADEEPKKEEPKKEAPKKDKKKAKAAPSDAAPQPGGGIQSNKAKASESPRLTKGRSCSGDSPKIMKVTPDEGKTGDKVTITGERFGEPGCISGVSFGPGNSAKFTQVDDKTITATVPEGKKGMEFLTVTGFTGQDTKPFLRK
jgi:IPT/TIG domain